MEHKQGREFRYKRIHPYKIVPWPVVLQNRRALYKHPAVLEAACVAIPDERWGEMPAAIIVLKEGKTATETELVEFCRNNLAHFKCPRSISFVESLPRTATGKIQKNLLRAKYWEGREKRVS